MDPRIPRSKEIGDTVRRIGHILGSRDKYLGGNPEFESLGPRGIKDRSLGTHLYQLPLRMISGRSRCRSNPSPVSPVARGTFAYLPRVSTGSFFLFFFQTNDGGGKSGNGTLNLGSRGLVNDPTLFRGSVLLGLGFPMFEGYEGIVGRSYRSPETDPASRT